MASILSGLNFGGNTLDVTALVAQLMKAEQPAQTRLGAEKSDAQSRVNAFGSYKNSAQNLADALRNWSDPSTFAGWDVQSTGRQQISASVESATQPLQWSVRVTQRASIAHVNIKEMGAYAFSSGGKTMASPADLADLKALRDWFNSHSQDLDSKFRASLVTDAQGQDVLTIQGLQSGLANDIAVVKDPQGSAQPVTAYTHAQDAQFEINGVSHSAGNNRPLIEGVRLSLQQLSTDSSDVQMLEISPQPVDTTRARQTLADAYNAYRAEVRKQTLSDSSGMGSSWLRDQLSAKMALRDIRSILDTGFIDTSGKRWSLSDLGLTFNQDGTMALQTPKAGQWPTTGLTPGASQGIYQQWSDGILGLSGWLAQGVEAEQARLTRISDAQLKEQDRLDRLQKQYIAQFSALNATLAKLNQVNASVQSAINGLWAQNKSSN